METALKSKITKNTKRKQQIGINACKFIFKSYCNLKKKYVVTKK